MENNSAKIYLLLANGLLALLLIVLSVSDVLPLGSIGDLAFYSFLILFFALYRPGWAFLFFVGTLALENINLAPQSLGLALRPYQLIGGLTLVAVLIRALAGRLHFPLLKPILIDWLLLLIPVGGLISGLLAEQKGTALKLATILFSFWLLYYLARNYVQNSEDLKRVAPFFLSSGAVVALFSIWQNLRFSQGLSHFETMPGRPNGTFSEPDWLGIYLVLLLTVSYAVIFYFTKDISERGFLSFKNQIQEFKQIGNLKSAVLNKVKDSGWSVASFWLLVAVFMALILTVSRSAWLGVVAVTTAYFLLVFGETKFKDWKKMVNILGVVGGTFLLGLALVLIFNLTSFQLGSRAGSTASGWQKITVACSGNTNTAIPEKIENTEQLAALGCRHINLEDIEKERELGHQIQEVYRPDPNISLRSRIFGLSWAQIKNRPVFGIGWGNITAVLGSDDRGTGLNSSNLFLEVWLGSGLVGVLGLVLALGWILVRIYQGWTRAENLDKIALLWIILGLLALLIPNLFNAGTFLAILWVFLGMAVSLVYEKE